MRSPLRSLAVVVALLVPVVLTGAPAAYAQDAAGSAVTVKANDSFPGLEVTVDQTTNLINQTVRVTWKGGKPTPGLSGTALSGNFLQFMQCWGDDTAGPDRTQCQYGKSGGAAGSIGTRKLVPSTPGTTPGAVFDPKETLSSFDATTNQGLIVPFWEVGRPGGKPTAAVPDDLSNPYFDEQSTNEIPIGRTRIDGTGEVDFEVQTRQEAPGLGCGAPIEANGTVTGQSCWLVIVPRGDNEVTGSPPAPATGMTSSPLVQSNWDNRITVKLGFLPQGQSCPLGAAEQRVTGHELAVDAVSRWQPALCAGGGALYSYTQLSDDLVRDQVGGSPEPGLNVLSGPVTTETPDRPIVYAPLALSGLAIAFRIVRNPPSTLEPDSPLRVGQGSPFTDMKLTARLVAKLLTQSYKGAVVTPPAVAEPGAPTPTVPSTNPDGLTNDPEFLALNPDYDGRLLSNLYIDTLVQGGTSDLTGQLWAWVLGDAKARAFLSGTNDPADPTDTTVVNSANKNPVLPVTSYPRNDQFCRTQTVTTNSGPVTTKFCTADAHLFTTDMHDSARSASRGDQFASDGTASIRPDGTYAFTKLPRQRVDEQAALAVVDVATATRYGLPTASLQNASGAFVAPAPEALLAGLAAMKPTTVAGVLAPDPATPNAAAYPLTSLSYAATAPSVLTADAGKAYATFLRYAAGAGQTPGQLPGQLPLGYAPLPDAQRQQTLTAATTIETDAGKAVGETPTPTPAPTAVPTAQAVVPGTATGSAPGSGATPTGTGTPGTGTPGTGTTGTGSVASPAATPAGTGTPPATPAPTPAPSSGSVTTRPVSQVQATPALPAPAVGALLVALLIGGALAAVAAPVTHLLSTRRGSAEGGESADRTAPRRVIAWPTARPALVARRRFQP